MDISDFKSVEDVVKEINVGIDWNSLTLASEWVAECVRHDMEEEKDLDVLTYIENYESYDLYLSILVSNGAKLDYPAVLKRSIAILKDEYYKNLNIYF